jgi:hypothetical protein
MAGEAKRVAPSRAKQAGAAQATESSAEGAQPPTEGASAQASTNAAARRRERSPRMPLIVVAHSPNREAAMAGLERWKARHPQAACQLTIEDVLVDSMRGRSSTWTRVRVNLRHVPEAARPPPETPDPDDDPTREWRSRRG